MARGIRDNERKARAELVVIEEESEPLELTDVSQELFYICTSLSQAYLMIFLTQTENTEKDNQFI